MPETAGICCVCKEIGIGRKKKALSYKALCSRCEVLFIGIMQTVLKQAAESEAFTFLSAG